MNDEKRRMGEQAAYRRMGMEQGLKEGRELGRELGLAEGRAEGRAEGKAEGLFEGKAEIVRNMYYNGLKKEQIVEMTGIPIAEIDVMLAK